MKSSKRTNLKKRTDKANYSHNWLLTTLKGHTGSVLDMSFSSNGKYLATCADGKLIYLLYFLLLTTTSTSYHLNKLSMMQRIELLLLPRSFPPKFIVSYDECSWYIIGYASVSCISLRKTICFHTFLSYNLYHISFIIVRKVYLTT